MFSIVFDGELKFYIMCIVNIILNIICCISYCIYFILNKYGVLLFLNFLMIIGMILIWVG